MQERKKDIIKMVQMHSKKRKERKKEIWKLIFQQQKKQM